MDGFDPDLRCWESSINEVALFDLSIRFQGLGVERVFNRPAQRATIATVLEG